MSLDKNLFTLVITPDTNDPTIVDLVDPAGVVHYRKQRISGPVYKIEVYDPASQSLLITAEAPSASSKHKTLELCNPTSVVELKHTGTLTFRWAFKWEQHEFEWRREECFMIRKPDPPVLVAVTSEPPGRIRTRSVQILDYNLNRFDIDDRKGLEIVILTSLLTFSDSNESYHSGSSELTPPTPIKRVKSSPALAVAASAGAAESPSNRTASGKSGVDAIAQAQAIVGEMNEVDLATEGSVEDYAQYCWNLLQDDSMLFITIRSAGPETVPKVLEVAHQTRRLWHKAGLSEDLHQYAVHDEKSTKGPKRINLDDDNKDVKKYQPPSQLTLHLSKIPMPELQPKANQDSKKKEDKGKGKGKRKEERKGSLDDSESPKPHKSIASSRVHSHQIHPHQPSPSPSQLNNPIIYTAPPPRPRPPRNHRQEATHAPFYASASEQTVPTLVVPRPNLPPRPNSFHGGFAPPPAIPYPANVQTNSTPIPGLPAAAQKLVTGILGALRPT